MSKISDLAADFEAKSTQQVNDIEQRLQSEFKRHEKHISKALRSSEDTISSAIDKQSSRLRRRILSTWLWMIASIFLVLSVSWGVIWYQGTLITENWDTISQQKNQLNELEKYNVSTMTKKGLNYLILPQSAEITDTYNSKTNHPVVVWKK